MNVSNLYPYLNEREMVREYYSCFEMIVQAHLHVGFSTYVLLNGHYLNDVIYIWNCFNPAQFLNKKLSLKFLHEIFFF